MPPIALPDPPLADARVLLRPWADADAGWLARESQDPLVPRYTTVPEGNSQADVLAFLMTHGALLQRREQVHLLTTEREAGGRVGPVGLHHVDWRNRTAEVGYWTARAARGRGLTSAGVRLLCAWALGPLGLERLELRTAVENTASQHVARACGFTREGVLRDAEWRPGGRRSLVVFGLLAGGLT
jgi:RimJ/RimL family protein N-acetyltransferase